MVVLGEARIGKTYELRARAAHLLADGRYGFYVTLADVYQKGIGAALPSKQQDAYQKWCTSDSEATILIDSADEARVLQQIRLHQGLRQLRKELGQAFARTRLVLACRASDWRPGQDLQELEDALDISAHKAPGLQSPQASVQLYQMVTLDAEQIEKIAAWKFGDDRASRDNFLDNLWKAQRWIFAGRPADLLWLIAYWKTKGNFGSFAEITEENIKQKLLEENLDYRSRAHLDETRARDGARRLAAAVLFGRATALSLCEKTIADNGNQEVDSASSSINPGAILTEYRPNEIDELLSRPIFDEATYGRVRFHHRTVLEYLTADWLKDLHQRGCPAAEIIKPFG